MPEGDHQKAHCTLLCDLHALSTIEADRAWFLEHGRLSASRSKAITREIGELCRRIRPLAVDLVDAFGVPAEMLRSPGAGGVMSTVPGVVATRFEPEGDPVGTAVVVPGRGYPPQAPLLFFAGFTLLQHGWRVEHHWWDPPAHETDEQTSAWVREEVGGALPSSPGESWWSASRSVRTPRRWQPNAGCRRSG